MKRSRVAVVLAFVAVAVAVAGGCERAAELPAGFTNADELALDEGERLPPRRIDLLELFPTAQARAETREIDFGEPDLGEHLLEGWGTCESSPEGGFTWGLGERSILRFFAAAPRHLELSARARALSIPGALEQRVQIELNGAQVTSVVVPTTEGEVSLSLPVEHVLAGWNELVFRYAYHRRPSEFIEGSQDSRPLATQWDILRFNADGYVEAPRLEQAARGEALLLPFLSSVDYHLSIPSGSVLVIGDCRPWPRGAGGRLEITFTAADAELSQAVALPVPAGGTGTRALRCPPTGDGPVQLSLRAACDGEHPAGSAGLRLLRPAIHSPAADEPEQLEADAGSPAEGERERRPNIILYLIDTLRADHLGCYGYQKPTSPNMDEFARDAIRFDAVQAQSSWTRPAVTSILTGVYPQDHGVIDREHSLPDSLPLLSEMLSELGYETRAVVTNLNVSQEFGFDRGYDSFEFLEPENTIDGVALSDAVNEAAFAFLEAAPPDQPFFLYLHTADPHDPYVPRSPFREAFAGDVDDPAVGTLPFIVNWRNGDVAPERVVRDLIALYDAEIAFNDAHFGALIEKLQALGLFDSSIILLISDHGEGFYDHGRLGHGRSLHREEVRVPLLLRLPGGEGSGESVDELARQIDVLPTLLDYLGAPVPSHVRGASLLPLVRSGELAGAPRSSFAHLLLDQVEIESVQAEGRKVIHTLSDTLSAPRFQLYDVLADPEERENLATSQELWLEYYLAMLRATRTLWPRRWQSNRIELDEELERRLRALGYF